MELGFTKFLETLLLPPGGLWLSGFAGLAIGYFWRRLGMVIVLVTLLSAYALSTPLLAGGLTSLLQTYPALKPDDLNDNMDTMLPGQDKIPDAIVILAGGRYRDAVEYGGGDTVSTFSLERLRYGAYLHRKTKLPIIVTGGVVKQEMRDSGQQAEAMLMKDVLEEEFDVSVSYTETGSHTTYENAKFTADLLKQNNFHSIYLVTTAVHMPRAVEAFNHFGVNVIPAPTVFYGSSSQFFELGDILPDRKAQYMSDIALHELVGRWWYQLRYY